MNDESSVKVLSGAGCEMMNKIVVTLYRPVGQAEFELIRDSRFREFPTRLPEQPIFNPVLNEEYATQIARDWNIKG